MTYEVNYRINNRYKVVGKINSDKDSEAYTLAYEEAGRLVQIYPIDRPGLKGAKTLVQILNIINEENNTELKLNGKPTKVEIPEIEKILDGIQLDD